MSLSTSHGGTLINRVLLGDQKEEALRRATTLKKIPLGEISCSDLELIAVGAMSPLTGFMRKADYDSVVQYMRLDNGLVWSIPITLPVSQEMAHSIRLGEEVALTEADGRILGLMKIEEKFTYDRAREAKEVYRTAETAHPGVARLMAQGGACLAGEVWMVCHPSNANFKEFRYEPSRTRQLFRERGWESVVAFQTRNPVHRAHEYIQKCAMEIVDGLFLHPLVGETKKDDVPAELRMQSYQVLLQEYYPPSRVVLGVFPAAMRYAGPREAIFHAICRKNYGCTHIIIGRDHAGVGKYYGTYDAQKIFSDFKAEELGITPLFFEHSFYCKKCGAVVTTKTCPHDNSYRLILSGTQVREMLAKGEALPPEFSRPEVAQILINGMREQSQTGGVSESKTTKPSSHEIITIVSGLPRSGTSMMMKMLEAGGMPVLTDNLRTADEDNPKGYYEFERVKQIVHDKSWLPDARGKAVKIISKLLKHLPPEHKYKVIFMRRKIEETLASQRRMLIRRGKPTDTVSDEKMTELFRQHLVQLDAWLKRQPHIETMYVDYSEMIASPAEQAQKLNQFLGNRLDAEAMASVIDPSLHRQRC